MRYSISAFRKDSTETITEPVMGYGLDAAHEAAEAMRTFVSRNAKDGDSVEIRADDHVLVARWVLSLGHHTSGHWLSGMAVGSR